MSIRDGFRWTFSHRLTLNRVKVIHKITSKVKGLKMAKQTEKELIEALKLLKGKYTKETKNMHCISLHKQRNT